MFEDIKTKFEQPILEDNSIAIKCTSNQQYNTVLLYLSDKQLAVLDQAMEYAAYQYEEGGVSKSFEDTLKHISNGLSELRKVARRKFENE